MLYISVDVVTYLINLLVCKCVEELSEKSKYLVIFKLKVLKPNKQLQNMIFSVVQF